MLKILAWSRLVAQGSGLLALGLGAGLPAAQAQCEPGPFAFGRPGQQRAVVSLRLERNLLVVKAFLNGKGPFNFLLDTGVSAAILTRPHLADSLGLSRGKEFRLVGAGGEATGLRAYEAVGVRTSLGSGIEAPAMTWLVLSDDVLNLSGYVGTPIHGIIGSEVFRSFVVELQPDAGRLLLHAPARFRVPQGRRWASLPLHLERNKAYLTLPVRLSNAGSNLALKLVLDTGAGHALSLETDADPRLVVPPRHLPAELGRGLGGVVRGSLGRVDSLRLGPYALPAVLTSFPNGADVHHRAEVPRHGNIGYELLKRFSLIVDYPHQRLLLRPNLHYREPFEHDMTGLELLAAGPSLRRYLVLAVAPNSPAAAADIQPDDELISVNLLPASTLSISQLHNLLHSGDGRQLLLLLRRGNGDLHTTIIKLKRQI